MGFLNQTQTTVLVERITKAHPYWTVQSCRDKARQLTAELSPQLRPAMTEWLDTGAQIEYDAGTFSLLKIMGLCDVSYLDALELLDGYLKDPERGSNAIFFR